MLTALVDGTLTAHFAVNYVSFKRLHCSDGLTV